MSALELEPSASKVKLLSDMIEARKKAGMDSDEWLRALYDRYTQQFLSNANVVWTTGGIMIPVAFACFAAFFSTSQPTLVHLSVFGITSSLLMVVWNLVAERHRMFREECELWLKAIESVVSLNRDKEGWKGIRLIMVRRFLVCFVIVSWVIIAVIH